MADKLTLDRQAMKDRSTSHLRIYVGGLTEQATVEDLYDHFIPYGQINGIVVNRNFGFVQFEEESSAQEAIRKANGSHFQGKSINVRTSQNSTRVTETVVIPPPEIPAAVALTDIGNKDEADDDYDSFGNYIGDQKYREEEYDEPGYNNWSDGGRGGPRGRAAPRARGRGVRGRGAPNFRDRSPVGGGRGLKRKVSEIAADERFEPVYGHHPSLAERKYYAPTLSPESTTTDDLSSTGSEWSERGGYDRYQPPAPEYPRALPVPERNDCEIIVVSKGLTEYAEYIEGRLKRLGIVVDLLFPMEDVPIGKVLGNIASRGCLYAILVMPLNQENRSLTLTILHGLPQEHRNMPLEDALQLMSRNFQEVQRGGPTGREAVYALLGQLADGRSLTVLQYDKVIEYLQERREQQVKIEVGEPPASKTQVDLQQRILSILNDKKVISKPEPVKPAAPSPVPAPAPTQNKLLNDPTVRKALDSILQKFT